MKKTLLAAVALLAIVGCETKPKFSQSSVLVETTSGHGTGVHTSAGFILTAAHVIGDKTTVTIVEKDDTKTIADVLWTSKGKDVALLKLRKEIDTAKSQILCRSLVTGEPVYTIGNPQTERFALAKGFVANGAPKKIGIVDSVVSLDMKVIPGNSGGPVYDQDGFLVGLAVATQVYSLSPMDRSLTGIGYMVPVNDLCELLNLKPMRE